LFVHQINKLNDKNKKEVGGWNMQS
jgi:hypothetical protein